MSRHTPGPWSFKRTSIRGNVCIVFSDVVDIAMVNRREDTALIVAAPLLLAACELFTKGAHDAVAALNAAGIPCPSSIAFAAEKARAAIERANGEPT